MQDVDDGDSDETGTSSSGSSLENLMAVVFPPKTRVCGKQQVVARETCEEQATHDDKLQLVIAKLKAKNESMTEESPEEVAKAAKFQRIIEKIKSQHDEADPEPLPFYPASQYKPKNPKKTKVVDAQVKPSKQKKKSVASILREGAAKIESEREGQYQPGEFAKARAAFLKKRKDKTGCSHREACGAWMRSNKRATLLSGLTEKEMKRRRFA